MPECDDAEARHLTSPCAQADIRQLGPADADVMDAVLRFYGEAFGDPASYTAKRPSAGYLRKLLGGDSFVALAASDNGAVIGALCAYELRKFEQERSEFYIYDLAVAATHRRRGIATALIRSLRRRTEKWTGGGGRNAGRHGPVGWAAIPGRVMDLRHECRARVRPPSASAR